MDIFCNDFHLKTPPFVTQPILDAKFVERVHFRINSYFQEHKDEGDEFAQTAALLSRLMARRKNSFRRMIGFRSIRKLNAALCRLLRIDLPRDLDRFRQALPEMVFPDENNICSGVEVPLRDNLDYVLVRLINTHKIHERIRLCCTEAAEYFAKLMRSNYFIEINTLLLAVCAKLQSLSKILSNKCAALYSVLLLHRRHFPLIGNCNKFLPEEVTLPTHLEMCATSEESTEQCSTEFQNIPIATPKSVSLMVPKAQQKADIGTIISRQSKEVTFKMDQLETIDDVKRFIAKENRARKQWPNCVTKQILAHEWLGAQKLFERKLSANEPKKALNVFRKFVNSKIQN